MAIRATVKAGGKDPDHSFSRCRARVWKCPYVASWRKITTKAESTHHRASKIPQTTYKRCVQKEAAAMTLREELKEFHGEVRRASPPVRDGKVGFLVARRVKGWLHRRKRDWHCPIDPHKAVIMEEFGETVLLACINAWDKVKLPHGCDFQGEVSEKLSACTWRVPLPSTFPEEFRTAGETLATWVCLAADSLGSNVEDEGVYLACRVAAGILEKDHSFAAELLRLLVSEGVLKIVKPACKEKRHAARYQLTQKTLKRLERMKVYED